MQIESTFNHLRVGRLRLWEKRYKQNIQNLDFFKMCINFNVYNCIRNTRVYIYIYRETGRESMGTCFVFYNLQCTLFVYLLIWDRVELHMYTHAVLYSILTCTIPKKIFFHTRCECLRFRYTYFISDCICISVPWYVFFQHLLLNPPGGFEKSLRLVVKTVR